MHLEWNAFQVGFLLLKRLWRIRLLELGECSDMRSGDLKLPCWIEPLQRVKSRCKPILTRELKHIQIEQKHPHSPAWASVSNPSAASVAGCCFEANQQREWRQYPRFDVGDSRSPLQSLPGTEQERTGPKKWRPLRCLLPLTRQWLVGRWMPSKQ
jgi:hypothetical protein